MEIKWDKPILFFKSYYLSYAHTVWSVFMLLLEDSHNQKIYISVHTSIYTMLERKIDASGDGMLDKSIGDFIETNSATPGYGHFISRYLNAVCKVIAVQQNKRMDYSPILVKDVVDYDTEKALRIKNISDGIISIVDKYFQTNYKVKLGQKTD